MGKVNFINLRKVILICIIFYFSILNIKTYSQCVTPPSYDFTITPTTSWQTTSSSVAASGCKVYRIYMFATYGYDFSLCGADGVGGTTNNDGDFTMYNSAGTQQWYIDGTVGCGFDASTLGSAYLNWAPPSDGYYYLKIDDYSNAAMTYTLAYKYSAVEMKVPSSGNNSYTICSGNLYDIGGSAGNYTNSCNGYTVINTSVAGNKIQVSGTSSGEACCDYLSVYNGIGTGGTLLGTYYMGTAIPSLTSTDASGALTVLFYSDFSTVGAGFNLTISCFTSCATVAGTSSSSINTSCAATNTSLSLTGEGAGTIQWQQSTDGGSTWTNIAGATTDPYIFAATVTTSFRAAVTSGCTSYSTVSSITISCDITQPATGFASSTILCGNSYTYRDPGGTSDYGNNQNGLITICPSTAGQYVNVNFTSFDIESGFEYFYVFDGDNASAPILGVYSGTNALLGNVKATSSNSSGCLSFRFYSDGSSTYSGWVATVTCSATPSASVPTSNPEDCQGVIVICSNSTLIGGTNNYGFNELPNLWNSCIDGGENESNWYAFSSSTNGIIGFQITPNLPTDYDWAIWGPYTSLQCPAFNNDVPIRCSSTELIANGNTGLVAPATDVIEQNGEYGGGANENGFLAPLNVLAGEVYVMMLDNWEASTVGFELSWNLSNGATLDCTPPLPVSMTSISNSCDGEKTVLEWTTSSETNNNYFAIEKTYENFKFIEIARVMGAGNSNNILNYSFIDPSLNNKTTYYRIKQVDFNGDFTYHRTVASNCSKSDFEVVIQQLTSNTLDLTINCSEKENVIINLYDTQGRFIAESREQLTKGNNKINIGQFNIQQGIYLLNIVGNTHSYKNKIIRK